MSEIPAPHNEIPREPRIILGNDRHHIDYFERTRNGQEHARTFEILEGYIKDKGGDYSFKEELQDLAQRFSDAPRLTVLDGGCGVGNMLDEIKDMESEIGKPVETVGVTLEDHPYAMGEIKKKNIDQVYVGGMKEFHDWAKDQKQFHFIIDSSGYAFHDYKTEVQGSNIIPLYADMLVPGGKAFLSLGMAPDEKVQEMFKQNGLDVTRNIGNSYYVVEKKNRTLNTSSEG